MGHFVASRARSPSLAGRVEKFVVKFQAWATSLLRVREAPLSLVEWKHFFQGLENAWPLRREALKSISAGLPAVAFGEGWVPMLGNPDP